MVRGWRGEAWEGGEVRLGGGGGEGERMEPSNRAGRGGQGWAASLPWDSGEGERGGLWRPRGGVVRSAADNGPAGVCQNELMPAARRANWFLAGTLGIKWLNLEAHPSGLPPSLPHPCRGDF